VGGAYQLLIYLDQPRLISVGKLGIFRFAKGYYIYTGSAMGGIDARVRRHLSDNKKFHWHIDYLLEHGRIIRYASRESSTRLECEFNELMARMDGAVMPVKGFGSSDCGCVSHLVYFEREPRRLAVEIANELPAHG
jgi:Uri superfamily endonuclease